MDKTHWTFAFTGQNQRIGAVIFITPTDSALNLILTGILNIFGTFDFHSLFQFLLIKFSIWKMQFVASVIFNSKSNSSQLDGIEFLNFIVVLSLFVFERSGN